MPNKVRIFVSVLVVAALTVTYVFTATPTYIPKYDASGNLVDSTMFQGADGRIANVVAFSEFTITQVHNFFVRGITNLQYSADTVGAAVNLIKARPTGGVQSNDEIGALIAMANDGANWIDAARLKFLVNGAVGSGSVPVDMLFLTGSTAGGAERMRLTSGGNVGIGTSSPSTKLHVVGDVTVTGNIAAKYQDIAEWVGCLEPVSAGTVMVIGSNGDTLVEQSRRKYDITVVGVVSPQPGITLGEQAYGKILVAHSGRVRVKVDASYGAIRSGDLLVTSPTAGHAMRSTSIAIDGEAFHRPGTILGKALEALPSGQGEVLALLTLQ